MAESLPSAVRGPVAAGCQVHAPHGAPHAGGVAVPAHRAGDRRRRACCWCSAACASARSACCCRAGRRSWPACWPWRGGPADVERWRIAKVRSLAGGAQGAARRPGRAEAAAASDPGLWLDVAHAVVVLPVVLVTSVVTALWWFVGRGCRHVPLRSRTPPGSLRPMTLYLGSPIPHRREPGADVAGRQVAFADHGRPAAAVHACRW